MSRFRKNHQQQKSGASRMMTFVIFAFLALVFVYRTYKDLYENTDFDTNDGTEMVDSGDWFFLPTTKNGKIVTHKHYALSYDEKHEQAEWVAYELTKKSIQVKNVKRTNDFRPDPKVKTRSANDNDYRGSGYDRGHMVPAADMAFSEEAMSETFFMSNISPQVRAFNQGIWRELEEYTRDWAYDFKHLYVVSGAIFDKRPNRIGNTGVSIPKAYYKVLLDLAEPEKKAIGFLFPNEVSYERINTFATSIDEIEAKTGIDFFPELLEDDLESKLESEFDMNLWETSDVKHNIRVKKWNKVR